MFFKRKKVVYFVTENEFKQISVFCELLNLVSVDDILSLMRDWNFKDFISLANLFV